MEEVDSIILHFLRELCINFDDKVKNICDIPVATIIEAASTCLNTINPNLKVPRKMPTNISHRIEVAAQIATFCKDLGYKNDVGYQTFLYSNEAELRQVFMFLIERLPNEGRHETGVSAKNINKKSLLLRDIGNKIADELKSIWIPPCCNMPTNKIGDFCDQEKSSITNHVPYTDEEIVQKLLSINDMKTQSLRRTEDSVKDITKDSKELITENKDIHLELNKNLKELKEMAIVLTQKSDTLQSDRNVMEVEYSQAQRACDRVTADLQNVENILKGIGVTEDDPKESTESLLDKVQRNINMLHKKSEELTSRNLSLKIEIDKSKTNNSESERMKYKKILSELKEMAKNMKDECDKKEVFRNRLKVNYEKLRDGNKRSIYTKRIMEIIYNVDKQDMEIKKILEDTRQLQKEINSLEGQLDRCFSIADETLFRDAKKDDQAKKAYKLLALLHSECNTIVSLVNDMGLLQRDIVDLEENIKTETAKRTEDTLKKIQLDIAKLQQES